MTIVKLVASSQHLSMGYEIGILVKNEILPHFKKHGVGGGYLARDFYELQDASGKEYRYYVRKHIQELVNKQGSASMKKYMQELTRVDNTRDKSNDADTLDFFKGFVQAISE